MDSSQASLCLPLTTHLWCPEQSTRCVEKFVSGGGGDGRWPSRLKQDWRSIQPPLMSVVLTSLSEFKQPGILTLTNPGTKNSYKPTRSNPTNENCSVDFTDVLHNPNHRMFPEKDDFDGPVFLHLLS
jgi:hypothetical protein